MITATCTCVQMAEEATSTEQTLEEVSELQLDSEEAAATSTHQPASMEKDSEPQQNEAEATQQPGPHEPVSSEKAHEADEPESEVATLLQEPESSEKASEPQQLESEEAKQPVSVEEASDPQQPESEEAVSVEKAIASEPDQAESEETKQPTFVEKASESHQAVEATSTQQPESMEKASEPQKTESTEVTSLATPTQQPESSEKCTSEPGQAESGEGAESQSKSEGGGWVTAYKRPPSPNVRIAPEVEDCAFCRIVAKLSTAYEVYRDDDFVCFEDKSPVSTLHYLLVPRKHYQDLRSLTVEHLPLLARMVELAKIVLKERRGDPDDVRMGFHLPPFLRVPHLHMHIISPASSMSWLNRNIVFRNDSFAFVSPNGAINYLKKSSK